MSDLLPFRILIYGDGRREYRGTVQSELAEYRGKRHNDPVSKSQLEVVSLQVIAGRLHTMFVVGTI